MYDILIWTQHDQSALFAVDTAQLINVLSNISQSATRFFIVSQPVTARMRKQLLGQGCDSGLMIALLDHRAYIGYNNYVGA